ncbi:uncharacterized protein EV422DRAFT_365269 [Fimicolochytrium jonesii]|uniref:uncharacterized protein n=1 Tax=Fimicolochytrium jonesii TaxID=1396493 RepID=UPI0022FECBE9|nr:uncharacterized protein EV422DRAFT_365269 [Fimicolochytrium jonesii]KAI8823672.1 hypothetical protein EV422DRAFT_365269 [Fimicolochytrium jonesii]
MTGGFLSDEALARQLQQAYDDDGYVYGDVSVADGDYWEDEVENDKDDSGMYDATSAASAKPAGERGSDDDDFVLRKKPKRGGSAKKASKLAAATPAKRGRKRKADPPTSDEASTLSADAKSSKVAKTETVSSKLSGAHQEANGNMHSSDVAFSESKLCEVEMVPAIARAAKSCGQSSTATSTSTPEPPSGLQATSEQGMKQGRWTEVEHASFLEGLELHGRNWAEVARHVGTRSKDIVKSRAQRHLIHLWLEGKDVPEKVKETGAGHTLSGKPLNPESAAVRPYLRSRKFDPEHPASTVVLPPHKTPGPENGEEMKPTPPSTDESAEKVVSARKRTVSLDYNKGSNSPLRKRRETNPGDAEKVQLEQLGIRVGEDGKTDYGRNRPRRETATKPKRQYAEDGYDLISCPPFKSLPGDGRPNCQPYRLRVERKAIAVMDLHSHLLDTEVVGLLAGVYDDGTKECTIQTALPAQRKLIAANASITVEASEESLAEALSTAESLGMQIVGWYHSHPIFCTLPSRIDCETQHAHQMAFGGSACNAVQDHGVMGEGALPSPPLPHESAQEDGKPFLGAICGPYNPKLETSQSELNWFVVVPSEAFPAGTPTPSYTAGSVAGADVAQPTRRNTVVPRRLQAVLQGERACRCGCWVRRSAICPKKRRRPPTLPSPNCRLTRTPANRTCPRTRTAKKTLNPYPAIRHFRPRAPKYPPMERTRTLTNRLHAIARPSNRSTPIPCPASCTLVFPN